MQRLRLVGALAGVIVALLGGSPGLADAPSLTIAPTGATAPGDTYPSISAGMFATVRGTVTCDGAEPVTVFVRVTQGEGLGVTRGTARTVVPCTGGAQPWHVNAYSEGRPFLAGGATVYVYASPVSFTDGGDETRGEAAVQLR